MNRRTSGNTDNGCRHPRNVRTVDLFCGCGGLSLGFDLHRGTLCFETVLAADIDRAALRVFNSNFTRDSGEVPTGRLCDLSWFSHRSEFLLYYLSHLMLWEPDRELELALEGLGFGDFLAALALNDEEFKRAAGELAQTKEYARDWKKIDQRVVNLALYRSVLTKLGLESLRTTEIDRDSLPWSEEIGRSSKSAAAASRATAHPALVTSAGELWQDQLDRIAEAAERKGRGQHRTVAARMARLKEFLESESGTKLAGIWKAWRSVRDSLRADFCLAVEHELTELYRSGRQVELVLGGPPCKGWSRIGRAVIESLRDQGVHAWGCKRYGDERNALLHKYVLVLDALEPSAFLFENVAHFDSSLRTPTGKVHAASMLRESIEKITSRHLSYEIDTRILRASAHGVPQDRNRYIMAGVQRALPAASGLSQFFHGIPRYKDEVPLKVALLGLEDPGVFDPADRSACGTDHRSSAYTLIDEKMPMAIVSFLRWVRQASPATGMAPEQVDAHIVRRLRDDDLGLIRFLGPGMRWMDYKLKGMPTLERLRSFLEAAKEEPRLNSLAGDKASALVDLVDDSLFLRLLLESVAPADLLGSGHHLLHNGYLAKGPDRHGDWLERLSPDRPSKTIVAHIGKDTYGYIHPSQARALSLREAARIQSFPDFFSFGDAGVVDGYAMIGNAVPPLLANHLADGLNRLDAEFGLFQTASRRYESSDGYESPAQASLLVSTKD